MKKRTLELLSPAANAGIAIQAVKHGADAVYIGASSHGARKSAANPVADIARVVDFAHMYRARVYVTVNTIVYEHELHEVERLCRDLYKAGVDALIVQDMALLRLDLPPIALHASTQCDIRTPEKARFLQEAGFSQLVLARELTLPEIRKIVESVDVPVECFVHGALCVSYSGRCHASCATTGRSANRGECAQLCRLPYTLSDASGKVIVKDKYLLSLKDFNASSQLDELVMAGVSSFKIEGRLKEMDYVKNVTSFYSRRLDGIISAHPEEDLCRSSSGQSEVSFTPGLDKSFNRGFTTYFLSQRRPDALASIDTPKSRGEKIDDLSKLHNGDGISYLDRNGVYQGVNVNRVEHGRIITARRVDIPLKAQICRTFDVEWQKMINKETAVRKINVAITIDNTGVTAEDERGMRVRLPLDVTKDVARKEMDYRAEFDKLGNTIYRLSSFENLLDSKVFIPRSELASLRRRLLDALDKAHLSTYPYELRREENYKFPYPSDSIDFRDNVANSVAERFYRDHGVKNIEAALETQKSRVTRDTILMTTRHCVLRELGMCKRDKGEKFREPLTLSGQGKTFRLRFDCARCEMNLLY